MKKKDLIELSITSALVIVLLFVLINSIAQVSRKKRARAKQESARVEPKREKEFQGSSEKDSGDFSDEESLFNALEERTKDITVLRDPFDFGGAKATDKMVVSGLRLTGVLWDGREPRAIIGDDVYGLGDKIGTAKIIKITPDAVILKDATHEFELRLK